MACKVHVLCVCLHVRTHLHVWVCASLWVYACSGECGSQQSIPGVILHELSLRLLEAGLFTGPCFVNEAGLAGHRASESHRPHLPRIWNDKDALSLSHPDPHACVANTLQCELLP